MNPDVLLAYADKLKAAAQQIENSVRTLANADADTVSDVESREGGRIQAAFEQFITDLPGFVTECASVRDGDLAQSAAAQILADAALQIASADSTHLEIMGRGYLGREEIRLKREKKAMPLLAEAVNALSGTTSAARAVLSSGCADNIQEWFRSSADTGKSYLIGPRKIVQEITYSKIDGLAIYEGCIELGSIEEAEKLRTRGEEGDLATTEAIGIVGDKYRWPKGIVYYRIASTLPNKERVTAAIAHWQEKTPLRFVPWTNQNNYVSFILDSGCSSRVGMQGDEQFIRLADGCSLGATIHEIGHCIGLWHEQSRHDRDSYVTVNFANIQQNTEHNFEKQIAEGFDIGEYDYGSIMHYPATAFSKNGQPTIVAKGGEAIGQRIALSTKDVAGVKVLYPDLAWK